MNPGAQPDLECHKPVDTEWKSIWFIYYCDFDQHVCYFYMCIDMTQLKRISKRMPIILSSSRSLSRSGQGQGQDMVRSDLTLTLTLTPTQKWDLSYTLKLVFTTYHHHHL